MKNGKFETKKEASDHATTAAALFWLRSAERILERSENPVRFSVCGPELVRDELDQPKYDRVRRWLDSDFIFHCARQEALQRLNQGCFPLVAKHFGI